jgi:hypothetical protein
MPAKTPRRSKDASAHRGAEMQTLFGANLRRARLEAELSQTDLAARAGIAQGYGER